jgi:hypothetical protein
MASAAVEHSAEEIKRVITCVAKEFFEGNKTIIFETKKVTTDEEFKALYEENIKFFLCRYEPENPSICGVARDFHMRELTGMIKMHTEGFSLSQEEIVRLSNLIYGLKDSYAHNYAMLCISGCVSDELKKVYFARKVDYEKGEFEPYRIPHFATTKPVSDAIDDASNAFIASE